MSSSTPSHDAQASRGTNYNPLYCSKYERMAGNCTRIIAKQMVASVFPPITSTSYILDNACGPGIVTDEIKLVHPDAKIMATDLNESMIEEIKMHINGKGWTNMETGLLDVRSLHTIADETFTHVFTNFGMAAPGDPDAGPKITKELFRVLQVGGVTAISTWADRVWPAAFIEVHRTIRPNQEFTNPWNLSPSMLSGSWLMKQLEDGGFGNNVEVRPHTSFTMAKNLDELTENMMLASHMFFKGYSEEELDKAKVLMKEALKKCRTYEEDESGVRIGMKAWIGMGWKRGDEKEVPQ